MTAFVFGVAIGMLVVGIWQTIAQRHYEHRCRRVDQWWADWSDDAGRGHCDVLGDNVISLDERRGA